MADERKLLNLTVDEFWATQPKLVGGESNWNADPESVKDVPAPTVSVRDYKFACELIMLPLNIRALYGTDEAIRKAYIRESQEGFPDSLREPFALKG